MTYNEKLKVFRYSFKLGLLHESFLLLLLTNFAYQPKSVGKMAGFEALTLCIPLNLSQVLLIFQVLPVAAIEFDSQPSSVFKLILSPIPCCYGLDVA